MARIAGINIPNDKKLKIALTYIYGIGLKNSLEICEKTGISSEIRVNSLSDLEVSKLREVIDKDYIVEGDLKRNIHMNIKSLMDSGCSSISMSSLTSNWQMLPMP